VYMAAANIMLGNWKYHCVKTLCASVMGSLATS
jgi:hypothetical protein